MQVISGDNLLILDPHGTHLQDQLPSVFGNMMEKHDKHFVDMANDSPDQLEPFTSFSKHCSSVPTWSSRKHYPGTLFRLALRSEAAALRSEISKESLSADQFAATLQEFVQAAPDLLLFTRHVKTISVFIKDSKDSKCSLMHECSASVSNTTSTLLDCMLYKTTISMQDTSGPKTKRTWLKATHFNSYYSRKSGDVAILMSDDALAADKPWPEVAGKVYSVMALPLPPTSLPVHINGDFCLSSDRRTLWTGEGDRGQVSPGMTLQSASFL